MSGEVLISASVSGAFFPDSTFLNSVDKPFEVWRMIVRLTAFDAQTPPEIIEPQPLTLDRRIRLAIEDLSKNQNMTKAPTLVSTLQRGSTEPSWEWEVPYTIVRAEGFNVQVDSLAFPTLCVPDITNCANLVAVAVDQVRVEIDFEGFLLYLEPPSETR